MSRLAAAALVALPIVSSGLGEGLRGMQRSAHAAQLVRAAIDDDPLVEEIRERSRKDYEVPIEKFCSEKVREVRSIEAQTGRRGAVRDAEQLCSRCQLTKCWEYQDWVLDEARREAAEIRQTQRDCLNTPLRR